jgi:gliding motility-associated-like protein
MHTLFTQFKPVLLRLGILLIYAIIFLSVPQSAQAGHIVGSEISYRWISGNTYEIKLVIYRDCGSPIPAPNNPVVRYSSIACNKNNNVTLNALPGTGQEITHACNGVTTCSGGVQLGIQKFEYTATVTLTSQCPDWIFGSDVCCRNCNMTTVPMPGCSGAPGTYVEATLNNVVAPTNSSPYFAFNPIQIICTGQPFTYNNGTIELNGDSLAYSFITPREQAGTNINYSPPYSGTNWVSSSPAITINSSNGDVSLTATSTEISAMAVLVREYRNGILVGSIVRDVVVWTMPCSNTLPAATGINGTTSFSMTVCAGTPVNFNVYSSDTDPNQNVSMTWSNSIPGATFTSAGSPFPTGHFTWTPTIAQVRSQPYTFAVMVEDNSCPQHGYRVYSYAITVAAATTAPLSTNSPCANPGTGTATVNATGTPPLTYSWSPSVSTGASANGLTAGTYTVTVTESHGCTATASFVISSPPLVTANVAASSNISCNSANDGSIAISASGGVAPYTYQWTPSGGSGASASNLPAGTYTVLIRDANNCQTTVQSTITQPTALTAVSNATAAMCNGDANGSALVTPSGGIGPYTYYWTPGGSTTNNVSNMTAGTYSVTITDAQGCTKNVSLTVNQPLPLAVNVTNTPTSCAAATGTATANITGGTGPYSYQWSTGATTQTASNLAAGGYSVIVTDANGCTFSDAAAVSNLTGPTLSVASVTQLNCNGDNNGTASVNVLTGVHPLTYQWSPAGGSQPNASGLSAGTYTITVTDGNNCASVLSIDISEPPPVTASVTPLNPTCNGSANGSISASASGGTPQYTYSWTPGGASTATLSNAAAGNYHVTVTDSKGCTFTASSTLSQPAPVVGNISNTDPVSCYGGNNGGASVSVSGGIAPYDYSWSPSGGNQATAAGLGAGNYTVIITDANNCTSTVPVSVTQPALLVSSITPSQIPCNGGNNGVASVMSTGGTSPFSYAWTPAINTTSTLSGLAPGGYSVIVTDANGCSATAATTITEPSPIVPMATAVNNLTCFGSNNGSGTISTSGGASPYGYSWSPSGGSSASANHLLAGVYTITVTDANGCTATTLVSINEPAELMDSVFSTNVTCSGMTNGSASFSPYGGTGPYTYVWNTGDTSRTLAQLGAGSYSATITDAAGCTITQTYNIVAPAPVSINPATSPSTCGNANGSVSANVTGGTSPYSYLWNTNDSTASLTGLIPATYTVQVTDVNGCTASANVSVAAQPGPQVSNVATTNVHCNGGGDGSAAVSVNGGTGMLHYQWSPSGGSGNTANGLTAGNYSITVTDANGCTATSQAVITEPLSLSTNSTAVVDINCFGNQNGQATIAVSGGTLPYQYHWTPGNLTTPSVSSLAAGNYTVTVTDANSCTQSVSISISQPQQLNVNALSTDISCFGNNNGTATVNVNGGVAPYNYNWTPNGNTTASLSSLAAGNYSVTVTDNKGCTSSSQVTINQPTQLNETSASTGTACGQANGTASVTISGGNPPYNYLWTPGGYTTASVNNLLAGSYTIVVTDSRNCSLTTSVGVSNFNGPTLSVSSQNDVSCAGGNSGSATVVASGGAGGYIYLWAPSGGNNSSASNLAAGTYSVQVTDASQCITSIPVIINQPQPLTTVAATTAATCNGVANGTASVNANGGVTPYQYNWSNGATTAAVNNLSGGLYSATITDNNGCTNSVSVNISEPTALVLNTSTTLASCNAPDGSASVVATGGTPSYQYAWSSGNTSPAATGLASGPYNIVVTDANGCTSASAVLVAEQTGITVNSSSTNVTCNGASNGTAAVQITGGVQPFTYSWSPSAGSSGTLTNLPAGTFTVTINDANGCTAYDTVVVSEPPALNVIVAAQDEHCFGTADGTAIATASGGVSPLTYLWSNGATTLSIANLSSGNYSFTVTDANGCAGTGSATIHSPTQVTAAIAHPDSICVGQQVVLTASGTGGATPYQFVWQNGPATSQYTVSPTINTNYNVTVSDANGCSAGTASASIAVRQPLALLPPAAATICEGDDATLVVQASGGTGGPYVYHWSNGLSTQSIVVSPVQSTTYTVNITDNCTALPVTATVPVTVNPKPVVNFTPSPVTGCAPVTAAFNDHSTASSINCTYAWNYGDGTSGTSRNGTHVYTQPGNYTISHTVIDAIGCASTLQIAAAVQVFPNTIADFDMNPTTEATTDMPVKFIDHSINAVKWVWNFGDNSATVQIENPTHTYADTGRYRISLITMTNKGCVDTAFDEIQIKGEFSIYIPNAFTPNGDNMNDGFIPFALGASEFDMYIFDRWGLLIYHTTSLNSPWNGKVQGHETDCQNDVYVYKVIARDFKGIPHEFVGHVTLVR